MTMYCGGHGHTLPCPECAQNLRNRLAREAAGRDRVELLARLNNAIEAAGSEDVWPLAVGTIRRLRTHLALAETQRSSHSSEPNETEAVGTPAEPLRKAMEEMLRIFGGSHDGRGVYGPCEACEVVARARAALAGIAPSIPPGPSDEKP